MSFIILITPGHSGTCCPLPRPHLLFPSLLPTHPARLSSAPTISASSSSPISSSFISSSICHPQIGKAFIILLSGDTTFRILVCHAVFKNKRQVFGAYNTIISDTGQFSLHSYSLTNLSPLLPFPPSPPSPKLTPLPQVIPSASSHLVPTSP